MSLDATDFRVLCSHTQLNAFLDARAKLLWAVSVLAKITFKTLTTAIQALALQPAVWGISCLVLLPSPCNDSASTYHSAIFVKPRITIAVTWGKNPARLGTPLIYVVEFKASWEQQNKKLFPSFPMVSQTGNHVFPKNHYPLRVRVHVAMACANSSIVFLKCFGLKCFSISANSCRTNCSGCICGTSSMDSIFLFRKETGAFGVTKTNPTAACSSASGSSGMRISGIW